MRGVEKKHYVDGEWITIAEAAQRYGLTRNQIWSQMSNHKISLGTVISMYRDGLILGKQGRAARHMVDGKWMTVKQAAEMLGVTPTAIHQWMYKHKRPDGQRPRLAEAVAAYREGRVKRHRGHIPKEHRVGRKAMTLQEAADMLGISYNSLQLYMYRNKRTLAQTIKYYEARKRRKAEREIMNILGF